MLTGDLTAFGFPNAGGNPLEWTFDVTGGVLSAVFGGLGSEGGVSMGDSGNPFQAGGWGSTFFSFIGVADTFLLIPEPSTSALALAATIFCLGRRQRH